MSKASHSVFYQRVYLVASLVAIALPVILLLAFGVYTLVHSKDAQYIFAGVTLIVSFSILLARSMKKKSNQAKYAEIIDAKGLVKPSDNWSNAELEFWDATKGLIDELLKADNSWNAITHKHPKVLAANTAKFYRKSDLYDVHAIESLIAIENMSRRYRRVLRDNVPFIEQLKARHVISVYGMQERYGHFVTIGFSATSVLKKLAKTFTNPIGILADVVQERVAGGIADRLEAHLDAQLKRTFLEEVLSISMDLYSGRFGVGDDEVNAYKAADTSSAPTELNVSPVRVAVVGQISAGKSTLTNLLCKEILAETSVLPSTDDVRIYAASVNDEEQIRVVDMPGYDSGEASIQRAFQEATHADLILWVLRANQPAKNPDVQLKAQLDEFYLQNPNKLPPKIIGVVTHIDRLFSNIDWGEVSKSEHLGLKTELVELLDYQKSLLGIEQAFGLVSLNDEPTYGVTELQQAVANALRDARRAQLNRIRLNAASSVKLSEHFVRALTLVKNVAS